MDCLAKVTSQKPSLQPEGVDKIYPDHANALFKAGLAPPNFLTMGNIWIKKDEKLDMENKKEPDVNLKKKKFLPLCCLLTTVTLSIH